jgi:hypothetical protein
MKIEGVFLSFYSFHRQTFALITDPLIFGKCQKCNVSLVLLKNQFRIDHVVFQISQGSFRRIKC